METHGLQPGHLTAGARSPAACGGLKPFSVSAASWLDWLVSLPLEVRLTLPSGTRLLACMLLQEETTDPVSGPNIGMTKWDRWKAQVKEVFPKIYRHQKKTLALFVMGMVLSGSAVLQRVAEGISLQGITPAKMTSSERRLARFIANDRVELSKIWEDFLSEVLPFNHGKPLRFVLDGTPCA